MTVKSLQQEIEALKSKVNELRTKNLIYEQAVSAIADGFLIVRRDGIVIEINKAYCDYFGVSRDEVLGQHIYKLIPNSKMIEIMEKNIVEVDSLHQMTMGTTASGERMVAVSRMPVFEEDHIIASVALIKFSRYTITLANALRSLEDEVAYYRAELRKHGAPFNFDDLTSVSPAYLTAKQMAQRFADNDLPILLQGETGVGKEVFANALHQESDRRTHPFVCVNCASIPQELFESELFGYVEGAFTGSKKGGKKGKFELANHGTLFLDEIGDMPPSLQSKLLRVLQDQMIEKLGSEKNIPVDVRIIAATNQNLSTKVEEGKFRPDLFYRLNVLSITIPPLSERIEDIPQLAEAFLKELNEKYGRAVSFDPATMSTMIQHKWPGNVRELRNAIGRGFMLTESELIHPHHLPTSIPLQEQGLEVSISEGKAQKEKEMIVACLRTQDGNFTKAAKALGIHRATLYAKIHALGIATEQFRKNKKAKS